MRSSRPSALHLGAAMIAGALLGFVLPHLPAARAAEESGATPQAIADDDADKSSCKCAQLVCSSPDGMRNMIGQCAVRCHDGKTADCACGKCSDEGHIEKPSSCRCKSAD